jgi:parvulin-like peptidyl-prolyl isomerase
VSGRWRAAVRALALAALLAGCSDEPTPPGSDVAARIAGEDVRLADFQSHLASITGAPDEALTSEALSQLLDQYLEERLLVRRAAERGLAVEDGSAAAAAEALLGAEPRSAPSAEEVGAWYAAHAATLARPERIELLQLLTAERGVAERARRELVAGADFATVAARVSIDPAAAAGGQRGWFAREELPPAFADLLFRLPEGGVSEVIEVDYGFHVFRVESKQPAATPTLEEARPEIERRLSAERADATLARLVADARSRYAVEVFDRNLPFAYRGSFPISRPYEKRR